MPGPDGPDTFREESLYAFRFDLNDDSREEATFKIHFGEMPHFVPITGPASAGRAISPTPA